MISPACSDCRPRLHIPARRAQRDAHPAMLVGTRCRSKRDDGSRKTWRQAGPPPQQPEAPSGAPPAHPDDRHGLASAPATPSAERPLRPTSHSSTMTRPPSGSEVLSAAPRSDGAWPGWPATGDDRGVLHDTVAGENAHPTTLRRTLQHVGRHTPRSHWPRRRARQAAQSMLAAPRELAPDRNSADPPISAAASIAPAGHQPTRRSVATREQKPTTHDRSRRTRSRSRRPRRSADDLGRMTGPPAAREAVSTRLSS